MRKLETRQGIRGLVKELGDLVTEFPGGGLRWPNVSKCAARRWLQHCPFRYSLSPLG